MTSYRTDEEQVEILRKWWQDNGRALLTGVVIAVALVLGWDAWQQQQVRMREQAAETYQDLLDTVGNPGTKLDDVAYTTAAHLVDRLKSDAKRTAYATYGALMMARVEVDRGNNEKALESLQWAHDQAWNDDLAQLASLRMAQVLFALGRSDDALARLKTLPAESYLFPLAESLRGDILLAGNQKIAAGQAYQSAIDWLAAHDGKPNRMLELKRDALKVASPEAVVPVAASAVPAKVEGQP